MSCTACADMERTEGLKPDCLGAGGCIIPLLPTEAERALAIRSDIVALRGLIEAGPILALHGAGLDDIRLLALVENELREAARMTDENKKEYGKSNGNLYK